MTTHVVGVHMTLESSPPATVDDITDLIEVLTDALDEARLMPSVSSAGVGRSFELTIEVVVEGPELSALEAGIAAINKALAHADVDADRDFAPSHVTPTIRALETV